MSCSTYRRSSHALPAQREKMRTSQRKKQGLIPFALHSNSFVEFVLPRAVR